MVPGFHATVRFDQGARETISNILSDTSLQIPDPEFDLWCDRVIAAHEAGIAAFKKNT
jgi:hypothetical protein